jgi:hypothetical protein
MRHIEPVNWANNTYNIVVNFKTPPFLELIKPPAMPVRLEKAMPSQE